MRPRALSLFTGYGGLDEAVRAVFDAEFVAHCQYEPPDKDGKEKRQWAAELLEYRFPGVPNLGDITKVGWSQVEPVDLVCGGFPCTDVSNAGKRAGIEGDKSGLWSVMADAIGVLRPGIVVVENVAALLVRGFDRVLADLARLGFDAEWTSVRASDIGAPHRRERIFIVAYATGSGPQDAREGRPGRGSYRPTAHSFGHAVRKQPVGQRGTGGAAGAGWAGPGFAADSCDDGCEPVGRLAGAWRRHASRCDRTTAHAECSTRPGNGGTIAGDSTGSDGPGQAIPGRRSSAAANAARNGRDEGRPESEGIVWGSDAALGGRTATNTAGECPEDVQVGCDTEGLPLSPVTRAGHRDRGRESAAGVERLVGGSAVVEWGPYEAAIRRWESVLDRPAPAPWQISERTGNRQLSARFTEWMMGLPDGWVTDVPAMTRNAALHILGNGVVPQQAEYALRLLLDHSLSLAGSVS